MSFRCSDEHFRQFFETAPAAYLLLDQAGKIQWANARLESMFGYDRAKLLHGSLTRLMSLQLHDRTSIAKCLEDLSATKIGEVVRYELVATRSDSAEFPAQITIRRLADDRESLFAAEVHNLSEGSSAENRFRELLESISDCLLLLSADGTIRYANGRVLELLGYSRQQLLARSFQQLLPDSVQERFGVACRECVTSRRPQRLGHSASFSVMCNDGTVVPTELTLAPVEAEQRIVIAVSLRDISGQFEFRRKLIEHLSDLAHESRLSTMGEMIAGLAHELNQPLYAISNYARACENVVRSDPNLLAKVGALTDKLSRQALRAANIVRRLRRFISRREPRKTHVCLNALIREVEQLMLFHAQRFSMTMDLQLAENLPRITGDSLLLEQVLVNLIRNAFEAMSVKPGARAVVTIRTAVLDDHTVEATVCDTGPGFGQITSEQLFEAFFTTKERGMGLGLAICKSIVEAHGGRLTSLPNPSGGAMFRMTLPVCEQIA